MRETKGETCIGTVIGITSADTETRQLIVYKHSCAQHAKHENTTSRSNLNIDNKFEMLGYLKEFHCDDITNLLNDSNDCLHVSLSVNLTHLQRTRPLLYADVLKNVWEIIPKWNEALLIAQKELIEGNCFLDDGYQIKENCHVRFVNLPQVDGPLKGSFPGNDHVGQFVQVKGNVIRMTQGRLLEFKREYRCTRCKETYTLEAEYNKMYVFETPKKCPDPAGLCKGNLQPKNPQPKPEYCMDYQEIRIQELFSDKYIPSSLLVTLEHDLVDYCQPGDSVVVCGTIEVRWPQMTKGKRFEVSLALRAVSVFKDEEKINFGKDLSEQLVWVRAQWQHTVDTMGYLKARDEIVKSICPEIHGMYLVKLAIALALCSGVQCALSAGNNRRGSSHLLLVGDPGLAKSRLLKAASKIAVRSVHTTGMGCSAAGLTAAAIKEEGEWQLEAGALVLADGGVCCIDEFNLMSENDKASIHEAMEQQTISMAKAGLVCKLSTRCVVLAATNPKNLYGMAEREGATTINIGIASPLLSRFDIVLILRDERDPALDNRISDHIIQNTNSKSLAEDVWELERLQSHFLAVQDINPELTNEANIILGSYYKYCRSDSMRDSSRTTARLLDSLNRLAQAHARLMFREKVEAVDAIAVLRLMESSWGFGRLLNSIDVLREDLPLGPDETQVAQVIGLLGLDSLQDNVLENLKLLNTCKPGIEKSKKQNISSCVSSEKRFEENLQINFQKRHEEKSEIIACNKLRKSPEKKSANIIQNMLRKSPENMSMNIPQNKLKKSPENELRIQPQRSPLIGNLQSIFGFNKDNVKKLHTSNPIARLAENKSSPKVSNKQSPKTSHQKHTKHPGFPKILDYLEDNTANSSQESPESNVLRVGDESNSTSKKPHEPEPQPSCSTAELSEKPMFDANIFDDSSDMDLFKSLDTIQSQIAEQQTVNQSDKPSNHKRYFEPVEFDIDIDLDVDLDISSTPKSGQSSQSSGNTTPNATTSKRKTTGNSITKQRGASDSSPKPSTSKKARMALDSSIASTSKRVKNNSRNNSFSISLTQELKTSDNLERAETGGPLKEERRLSTFTLAKLNRFMNPKLLDDENSPQEGSSKDSNTKEGMMSQKESESDVNTSQSKFIIPGSSRFLESLENDDLDCLNFDI